MPMKEMALRPSKGGQLGLVWQQANREPGHSRAAQYSSAVLYFAFDEVWPSDLDQQGRSDCSNRAPNDQLGRGSGRASVSLTVDEEDNAL